MCKPHSAGSRHLLQLQSKCHFLAIIGLLVRLSYLMRLGVRMRYLVRVGRVSVRY